MGANTRNSSSEEQNPGAAANTFAATGTDGLKTKMVISRFGLNEKCHLPFFLTVYCEESRDTLYENMNKLKFVSKKQIINLFLWGFLNRFDLKFGAKFKFNGSDSTSALY